MLPSHFTSELNIPNQKKEKEKSPGNLTAFENLAL